MDTYLFDDPDSVVHFIIGFLLAAFFPFWFMAVGTLVFLIYEVREKENPISTVGDVVEFLSGGYLGLGLRRCWV